MYEQPAIFMRIQDTASHTTGGPLALLCEGGG